MAEIVFTQPIAAAMSGKAKPTLRGAVRSATGISAARKGPILVALAHRALGLNADQVPRRLW